jgi:hypothetical protein
MVRAKPDGAGLATLEHAYGYRLYELDGRGLWLIDLAIAEPKPGDRAIIRAARPLAPSYVDALRVLSCDEVSLEQLAWLTAAALATKHFLQPVLAFVSDDQGLDFVAIVGPDGVGVIGDRLGQYLLRWEGGTLAIQPFCNEGTDDEPPTPPEELALIPAVTMLETEKLASGGYPLHGNVVAEIEGFAGPALELGIGTRSYGQETRLKLVEARGLDRGMWDRAAGDARQRGR